MSLLSPKVERALLARSLTKRERELVKLIWAGCPTRVIAAMMAISPRTVEVHRLNLYRKLNVHNTAQLLRAAMKMGMCRL